MKNKELEAIYDMAEKSFSADKETQQKIKDSSDMELLDWLIEALHYGEPEIMPIANAIYKEALSRKGHMPEIAQSIWNTI